MQVNQAELRELIKRATAQLGQLDADAEQAARTDRGRMLLLIEARDSLRHAIGELEKLADELARPAISAGDVVELGIWTAGRLSRYKVASVLYGLNGELDLRIRPWQP